MRVKSCLSAIKSCLSAIIDPNQIRPTRAMRRLSRKRYTRQLATQLDYEPLEDRKMLTVITVDSLADDGADALTTLREAVVEANMNPDADNIVFASSLAGGTISLTGTDDTTVGNSALKITTDITISGDPGEAGITINGNDQRIFYISGSGDLTVEFLTLTGGQAIGGEGQDGNENSGGGGGGAGMGGAIFNDSGTLSIFSSTLNGNLAQGGMGGYGPGGEPGASTAGQGGQGGQGGGYGGGYEGLLESQFGDNGIEGQMGGNSGGPGGEVADTGGDAGPYGEGGSFGGGDGGYGGGGTYGGSIGVGGGGGGSGGGGGGGGSYNSAYGYGGGRGGNGGDGGAGYFGGGGGGGGAAGSGGGGGGGANEYGSGGDNGQYGHGGTGGFGGGAGGYGHTGTNGYDGQNSDPYGGGDGGYGGYFGGAGGGGAGMGGAIFNNGGAVWITNSTLAENQAIGGQGGNGFGFGVGGGSGFVGGGGSGFGGAIFNRDGILNITNSTIADNEVTAGVGGTDGGEPGNAGSADGGAVYSYQDVSTAVLSLDNSIFVDSIFMGTGTNSDVVNNSGTHSGDNNIIETSSGMGGLVGTITVNPNLDSLADNGGPTHTMAIQDDTSSAYNAGNNTLALDPDSAALADDQRGPGFDRISHGTVDIGAFEFQAEPTNSPPEITTNSLTLDEGETVVLGSSDLNTTDDNLPSELTYTASGVTAGQFELVAEAGEEITVFTQQQINDGDVQFVHDGGETAPSYNVTVSDGEFSDGPEASVVSFTNVNDAPTVANPIADMTASQNDPDDVIDLSNTFDDVDGDILSFTASSSDGSLVTATVVGTDLVLDYQPNQSGTAVIMISATDPDFLSVDDTFTVSVLSAQDQLDNMLDDVQDLIDGGSVNGGQGNALTSKLQNGINKLNRGNIGSGVNQLQSFINQVNALINSGGLTSEEGQPLIDAANAAIASALPGLRTDEAFVGKGSVSAAITANDVQSVFGAAIESWQDHGVDTRRLDSINVYVANLPDTFLGVAAAEAIWIDVDAAGHGWSLNASGGMDLLSAVTHELGHVLGFDHDHGTEVMRATLPVGQRLLPQPALQSSLLTAAINGEVFTVSTFADADRAIVGNQMAHDLSRREGDGLVSITKTLRDGNTLISFDEKSVQLNTLQARTDRERFHGNYNEYDAIFAEFDALEEEFGEFGFDAEQREVKEQ